MFLSLLPPLCDGLRKKSTKCLYIIQFDRNWIDFNFLLVTPNQPQLNNKRFRKDVVNEEVEFVWMNLISIFFSFYELDIREIVINIPSLLSLLFIIISGGIFLWLTPTCLPFKTSSVLFNTKLVLFFQRFYLDWISFIFFILNLIFH